MCYLADKVEHALADCIVERRVANLVCSIDVGILGQQSVEQQQPVLADGPVQESEVVHIAVIAKERERERESKWVSDERVNANEIEEKNKIKKIIIKSYLLLFLSVLAFFFFFFFFFFELIFSSSSSLSLCWLNW